MLLFRFARSGSLALGFLAWNLFLAAIPAVAAWFFARAMTNGSSLIAQVGWFVIIPIGGLAEVALMFWLIVKGVDVSKWREKPGAPL